MLAYSTKRFHWSAANGSEEEIISAIEALREDRSDVLAKLVNGCDEGGWTPLMSAVSAGHLNIVRALTKLEFLDITKKNEAGCTALHYIKNSSDILQALLPLCPPGLVDERDKYGCTALYKAAARGSSDIVSLLLAHEAGIDICDKGGVTPLQASIENRHDPCSLLLVRKGASVSKINIEGKTPVDYCHSSDLRNNLSGVSAQRSS